MSKRIGFILWTVAYFVMGRMAVELSLGLESGIEALLNETLFNLSRYYFTISLIFLMYLYVTKQQFTCPMLVSRCKKSYLSYVLGYGLKICAAYLLFTFVIYVGLPVMSGVEFNFSWHLFLNFFKFFAFLFAMYLTYLLILLKTNHQVLAKSSVLVINLILLFFHSPVYDSVIRSSYLMICVALAILVAAEVKRKEVWA